MPAVNMLPLTLAPQEEVPADIRKLLLARAIADSTNTSKRAPKEVHHPYQGIAHVIDSAMQGLSARKLMGDAVAAERAVNSAQNETLMGLPGGDTPAPSASPVAPMASAIAGPPSAPTPTQPVPMVAALSGAAPPLPPPTTPVPSTPRVMGTEEGTAKGYYDAPQQPQRMAQAAPQPPQQAAPQQSGIPPQVREQHTKGMMILNNPNVPTEVKNVWRKKVQELESQWGHKRPDYAPHYGPDGSITWANKNRAGDFHTTRPPGMAENLIDFDARKAAATTAAETRAKFETNRALTEPDRQKQNALVGGVVMADADRILHLVDNASLPTTGMGGSFLSTVGGTAANDVRALVDTLKANVGFQELNKMRQASPTGAALGAVQVEELRMLQATIANMEQSQSKEQFKDNVRRVKNSLMDTVHGPGKGPQREPLEYEKKNSAPELTKTIGGKTYIKRGNDWFVK
jgi:hypothetical protein